MIKLNNVGIIYHLLCFRICFYWSEDKHTFLLSFEAGIQSNINIELYDNGIISDIGNDCLVQGNYGHSPAVGACRLDNDQVILVGGKNNPFFFIHDVTSDSCTRMPGKQETIKKGICHIPFAFLERFGKC